MSLADIKAKITSEAQGQIREIEAENKAAIDEITKKSNFEVKAIQDSYKERLSREEPEVHKRRNIVAELDENDIDYEINEELGYLKVRTKKINDKSDVIYNTFLVGIQLLIDNYSDYITLITEEV